MKITTESSMLRFDRIRFILFPIGEEILTFDVPHPLQKCMSLCSYLAGLIEDDGSIHVPNPSKDSGKPQAPRDYICCQRL